MVVSTSGTGERSLFLSYISEVPVWKATYRIVLNSKAGQNPLLQGWAIVDNTVGQDWENVQLSLVAGAPQSFVQNLSQPFYTRRPVVGMGAAMTATPQTYESTLIPGGARIQGVVRDLAGAAIQGARVRAFDTMGNLAGEAITGSSGEYVLGGLPEGRVRVDADMTGFQTSTAMMTASAQSVSRGDFQLQVGGVAERMAVTAGAPALQAEMATTDGARLGSGRALGSGGEMKKMPGVGFAPGTGSGVGGGVYQFRPPTAVMAKAQELGDLFEYKLEQPITIRQNRSALVPILQSSVAAEKVSVFNEASGLPRPVRALWLQNTSGLTLDGGSFSILEEETFAGEGVFEPIRAGEKRLISYATDLAVTTGTKLGSEARRVTRVRAEKGVLTQFSEMREKKTYTFRNEDSSPRTMLVEHPVRSGFELAGDTKPAETTASFHRFRVAVGPKQTAALTVEEVRPITSAYMLPELTPTLVADFVAGGRINRKIEEELRRILAQKDVVARLNAESSAVNAQTNDIFHDQQRLRENLKALKGSAEEKALVQRYTQQLNEQETRLAGLKQEIDEIEKRRSAAQEELDRMTRGLVLDEQI